MSIQKTKPRQNQAIDELTVLDLFCGAGGLSSGLDDLEKFTPVLGVDKDENCIKTYKENISDNALCADLTTLNPNQLPVQPEDVDVVAGGPPCQDFSVANRYSRGGKKTNLVFVFADYVEHFNPDAFVMENVTGIKSTGDVLTKLIEKFESLNYNTTVKTLNADNFGVPQHRKRVFVVGSQYGSVEIESGDGEDVPVSTVLNGLPEVESGESVIGMPNMRAPNHQQKTIDRIKNTEQGDSLYDNWSARIRLDPDVPTPTLKAGQRINYHFAHPEKARGLTVRERALIQGFPELYKFKGTLTSQKTQTGNAVPPPLAKHVGDAIVQSITDNKSENYVNQNIR